MKTYLLQRATIEDRDYKKGIDTIISLDYMGASEYEWGAIPDSLRAIRASIPEYTYMDIPMCGKVVTVFCKVSQRPDVPNYLGELASGKMHTKCYNDFDNCMNPSEIQKKWQAKRPLKTNFWWDLDNDIMFWIKDNEFETKFKALIETKPE